jgi:hypothetical protein
MPCTSNYVFSAKAETTIPTEAQVLLTFVCCHLLVHIPEFGRPAITQWKVQIAKASSCWRGRNYKNTYSTGRRICNITDLYSGETLFESWPTYRLIPTWVFFVVPSVLLGKCQDNTRLDHGHLLPNNFCNLLVNNKPTIQRYIIWNTDSAIK